MKIRRIEIQNYKKLVRPVVIDDIGDGITVIAGDNEEGKSTVLQALRTVLFDRHNLMGDAAEAMQPFGHKVRPEIALVFDVDGTTYRLRKGYCQRAAAELVTPTGTLSNLAAEEKLQELLRFRPPGKGQGKPDQHHGVFGIFWIEQGRSFNPIALSADNRSALMGALEGEVGQVLGGNRGRTLREAVGVQYRVHFTDAGRPRGPLVEASSLVQKLETELAPLKVQLSQYETRVDDLARTRERLASYAREGRLTRAQSSFDQAEIQVAHITTLVQNIRTAENAKTLAETGTQGPNAQLKRREEAVLRQTVDAEASAGALRELTAVDAVVADLSTSFTYQAGKVQQAELVLDAAATELQLAERHLERIRLGREKERLSDALTKARTADELARNARGAAAAIKVDATAIRKLRTLGQKLSEAEAALAGSSTLIQFQLENPNAVLVGGNPALESGEISITDPTTLEIAGAGTLTVIPGGEELSGRRDTLETVRAQLNDALNKAGAETVGRAELLVEQRQEHLAVVDAQTRVLDAHAPDGLDVLSDQLSETQALLDDLPETEMGTKNYDLQAAKVSHRAADADAKSARTARDACQVELIAAQRRQAGAQAVHKTVEKAASVSALDLAQARELAADATIRQNVAAAAERVSQAQAILTEAENALAVADPEASELAFEQARDGLAAIKAEIETLTKTSERLAVELQVTGQQGLGETIDDLEGRLVIAVAQRDRVARAAAILNLLYETLTKAEQQAREAFLTPVQNRVRPYLKLLMPETELILSDDDLGITHLRRNGQDEPFESLSVGAREQIAVLTRLAFADLMREHGTTAPVVLDDALVNSDPHRFERMLLALRRAAKNLQVIVLTCDEADWVQAGAPMIRLANCIADA